MRVSTGPTAACPTLNPAATGSASVRVALVGGSGPGGTEDLNQLLRRRLLTLSTFLGAVMAFLVSATIFRGPNPGQIVPRLPTVGLTVVYAAAALILWRRPPRTVFGLRLLELVVFGSLYGHFLVLGVSRVPYEPLEWAGRASPQVASAYVGRYLNGGALLWVFAMFLYGMFIPNTIRRAVVVITCIAVSPVALFWINAAWLRPLSPKVTSEVLFGLSLSNAIAAAMVLVAMSRIEIYRRQASEARSLGQYVLRERLGIGGMGEVYRAEHALLRRPCALKVIRPERAGAPDALRRFEREVQITATLTHPNTVQVFDYGHAADGTFYYVMEYLPGLTLEELVRRWGPLPPGRVVHFLGQVCSALGEAHARGLTHRDIKPGNVIVCERGGVCDVTKLLDFGLVQTPGGEPDGEALTHEGTIAGTPAYLSPEQAGGEGGIGPRSDLYSVGAMAYFLLTGQPPFAGRSPTKVLAAHLYEAPTPLPEAVPAGLAAVVMRCLEKSPAGRWPDAAALGAALAASAVPAWTASDAVDWWDRLGGPACESDLATVTETWPAGGMVPDSARAEALGRPGLTSSTPPTETS